MNQHLINHVAFAVLSLLWLAFGAALLTNPEVLQAVWQTFSDWHWVVQALVTLVTLPVVLSLWIWQTSWPFWLRLIIVLVLAWITLYSFFPKKADNQTEVASAQS